MESKVRQRVLCVDDDPCVLEGLVLHLRRAYEVVTAPSGGAALGILARSEPVAVILSDMRMPGMDGVTLLARSREAAPDAVRVLLTGHADLEAAVAAINEGHVFRFLTKPCPPAQLLKAVAAAAEQHRLITAERVLLSQTLHGSINTLTEVLSLSNPIAFGHALQVKQLVTELTDVLQVRERWQVEVAAMLSQLGSVALPPATIEKVYYGEPLQSDEQAMVERVPALTDHLLAHIPRLEGVRSILTRFPDAVPGLGSEPSEPSERRVHLGACILRVAVDFLSLEATGHSDSAALDVLGNRAALYDPDVLQALRSVRNRIDPTTEVLELPVRKLRVGMVLAQDVKLKSGTLLIVRGHQVTASLVERLRNFAPGTVCEPVRVIVPKSQAEKPVTAPAPS